MRFGRESKYLTKNDKIVYNKYISIAVGLCIRIFVIVSILLNWYIEIVKSELVLVNNKPSQ